MTKIVSWTALLCALVFPLLLIPERSWWIYVIVPLIAILNGVNTPNLTAIISVQADAKEQGAILGMRQSIQSIAMAIPPIVAGFITSLDVTLPIWAAGLCTLLGWLVFRFGFLKHSSAQTTEVVQPTRVEK